MVGNRALLWGMAEPITSVSSRLPERRFGRQSYYFCYFRDRTLKSFRRLASTLEEEFA